MRRAPTKSGAEILPTEAELEILQVLWNDGSRTVKEVHLALHRKNVGYTTVLKQMQVMADKGLLVRDERFRTHIYSAKHPPQQTRRRLVSNFIDRAFAGSAKSLVLGALSAQPVSKKELAEIREAIQAYEERSR